MATKADPTEPGQIRPTAKDAANDAAGDMLDRLIIDRTVPFYLASNDGHLLHVNDRYRALVAQCQDRLPAPGRADRPGQLVPAALRSIIEEVRTRADSVNSAERLMVGEDERHYQGRHFPVCSEAGEVLAVAGTYLDVTEHVLRSREAGRAQQRFQDFARATSDWFWEADRDLKLTALSDRFTALTGQPAALLLGRRLDEVGVFDTNLFGQASSNDAFERRAAFREQVFAVESAIGEELRFHLSGVPVFDRSTGEFAGYRGAGMDVTDRYRDAAEARSVRDNLESTLQELTRKNMQLDIASAQAESALRAKNEFLAAMSHELRTPLNAIIGFAEAMNMQVFGELNDQYLSYCADIMNAGRHLLGLINDVLDVAVIESGEINLATEEISLKKIIDQAANLIIIRAKNKTLDTDGLTVERDLTVRVDDRRATQIFVNLLTNAVKFTPEGGSLGVEVAQVGDKVAVTVWDTGIGIPPDKVETVFEKFQQVTDNIYSRKVEGTGLGLHISRELARRMGGDITVDSVVDQGSRFTVTLPLKPAND